MLKIKEAELRELRLKYKAAYSAYQSCVRALSEVSMAGVTPSAEPLRNEAKALRELTEARANLLAAMTEVTNVSPSD